MRFIETIRNIWTIEELRKRILVTLLLVLVYRLGCYVVLPGISPEDLDALSKFTNKSGLMQLLDMFSGGAFSQASIFALGIMPYITASIVIQLLGMVLPSFQKLQSEGESGRQKLSQYTRYLTVLILLLQGPAYLVNLQVQVSAATGGATMGFWTLAFLTVILAAGSMFIMWLGERITDRGIGNGISFIILVGIIARLPGALFYEFTSRLPGATGSQGGLIMFVVEILLLFAVTVGAVLLVQGTRKVPVQYAKRIVGNRQYGGARQYIPLKVNAAGVMPIIFAQAIMFIPITLAGFGSSESSSGFYAAFSDINGFWYNLVYFILIVAFTYFYTAITVRPTQMAEDMKRNNGFIPGVKPGKKTAEYLDSIMSRITLPGSLFLGIVAILPAFARFFGISQNFAQFFGGTSLLILVGVVLDTLQQIESHLMMHHYDGLMKDGKIKGRTTGSAY
ncbi:MULTISPECIES: preprotein translocase subunit SecY [Duncaniella]|jgi:preprotein translocase subunit SecY|uniref:Protein translocase subunit SecY n=7 Tax=Duncaniella TaxID=2518495 RepID=A0A2V1IMA4_9BACT|nr:MULTISPECIES: preprotein translocase subunit SecY [Duncaniella]ROS91189.1 preprotein translocase subunit SecY [Muribaculaceae bacterium Isolate-039 (Harlan)]ROS98356.1 preprotein translocase subunit SecY [Muribaculaceae bacterium Isolate-083 (Janvier)]ROS98552.1 preprotein translocase subunit SecY [Muribaculaceae bacterium Isolate-077 (Janvier)]ROT01527.1 preprotein translocase subunit SecY [Muribaculaceae bacterium Isolate-084 (Janvier)]GFI52044.1 protein translocase subunit SecY [Muribacu